MKRSESLVKIRRNNQLSFRDGSTLRLNDVWLRALSDKLKHDKRTLEEFLTEFAEVLEERWKTKTCSDKFGSVIKWDEADEFLSFRSNFEKLADLAESELYYFLRAWILGLILSEHGGKGAIILTDDEIVEYPNKIKRDSRDTLGVASDVRRSGYSSQRKSEQSIIRGMDDVKKKRLHIVPRGKDPVKYLEELAEKS